MGKLIEYFIPANVRWPQPRWVCPEERGKVLEFQLPILNQFRRANVDQPAAQPVALSCELLDASFPQVLASTPCLRPAVGFVPLAVNSFNLGPVLMADSVLEESAVKVGPAL